MSYDLACLPTILNLMLAKTTSKFFIFTISNSYKSNMTKEFKHIFYFSYIQIRKKKVI